MPSNVEIANMALALLGELPIVDFAEDSDRRRFVSRIFQPTVDSVLRSHPWNCATFREQLGLDATAPAPWSFSYTLPSDPYCLRVLAVNDDEDLAWRGDVFKIEGRHARANISPVSIRYIGRVEDVSLYDTSLYEALAFRVAAALAMSLTGNANLAAAMWKASDEKIREARSADEQEGNTRLPTSSPLSDVRRGTRWPWGRW